MQHYTFTLRWEFPSKPPDNYIIVEGEQMVMTIPFKKTRCRVW